MTMLAIFAMSTLVILVLWVLFIFPHDTQRFSWGFCLHVGHGWRALGFLTSFSVAKSRISVPMNMRTVAPKA